MSIQGIGLGNVGSSYRQSVVNQDVIGQVTLNDYATLAAYNSIYPGAMENSNAPGYFTGITGNNVYIIPDWVSGGYEALTNQQPRRNGGYANIVNAYTNYSNKCGRYYTSNCANRH